MVKQMYVIIRYSDTQKFDIFGPSSLKECEVWIKRKKIYPRKASHTHKKNKFLPQTTDLKLTGTVDSR